MKRMKGLVLSILILAVALSCVCCSGKKAEGADYSTYMGKEYSGQDPWGNPLSIKLVSMEESTVSFEYKDVIGEDEYMSTFVTESSGEMKEGVVPFHITAVSQESESIHCEYSGTLELKDGSLFVTYEDGAVNEESPEGGSASYQAPALEGADKTVELTAK